MKEIPLGKRTKYIDKYDPSLLYPIARSIGREKIGIAGKLPFDGYDIWHAYEISWLNAKGKPEIAIGEFKFPVDSTYIIESKSLKLYLNSFNNTNFLSREEVAQIIKADLTKTAKAEVEVRLINIDAFQTESAKFSGILLDNYDIENPVYTPDNSFLVTEQEVVTETLYSNLLKSNCPVTNQPDFGRIQIGYHGKKINHTELLKYLISFRNCNEFHEQCIEQIFVDIQRRCYPQELTVYAEYQRRGGLDISPYRTTQNPTQPGAPDWI